MEREYIQWRTGAGCLVFSAGFVVANVLLALLLMWQLSGPLLPLAWLAAYVPFIWLSFRADRWALARRRMRRQME